MKIVKDTVTVARHRTYVFAYLADFRNDPAWRKETIGVRKITPGGIGPGTVFEDTIKYPGAAPVVLTKEITVYEPGRRIGFSSRSRSVPPRPGMSSPTTAGTEPASASRA